MATKKNQPPPITDAFATFQQPLDAAQANIQAMFETVAALTQNAADFTVAIAQQALDQSVALRRQADALWQATTAQLQDVAAQEQTLVLNAAEAFQQQVKQATDRLAGFAR